MPLRRRARPAAVESRAFPASRVHAVNPTATPIPDALRGANPLAERLRSAKNAAVGAALGKSEDWARKLLDGDQGVRLDDLPRLLEVLGLKVVDREKVCVHPELARAYHEVVKRAVVERNLLWEDAE